MFVNLKKKMSAKKTNKHVSWKKLGKNCPKKPVEPSRWFSKPVGKNNDANIWRELEKKKKV